MKRLSSLFVFLVLAGGVAVVASRFLAPSSDAALVDVKVPPLSELARKGADAFAKNCSACHGRNAAGSGKGPPLVHDIYNPGHHADAAFVFAARRGVRQHHWRFGNMPPQPQVSDEELAAIIRYVRELQTANGIVYRPHRM